MPGNHGEIPVNEQNGVGNANKETRKKKKKKKKKDNDVKEIGIVDDFENANQLVMPSIPKSRKRFVDKIRKRPKSPKRPSSSSSSRSGSRKGGCFSLMRPRRAEEEDSPSSPLSDPNDESFTHEMLRVMLETNDFCSNECNPHR